ncbi:MAG: hypothetical protein LBM98_12215 [Oscillospiraceae bacterium]|nr:hypothetical protein [Oscillospiraceae bacterium]
MLRTCNALRIAGLPVLRNDGLGRASPAFAPRRDGGRGYVRARRGVGGFETRPYVTPPSGATPVQTPVSDI